ncbi:hypothetical protein A7A08_01501 [Methyloligella halotolerans]|uniref:Uncharacterized protein n=1 Tax=Methyloligella halotolerans TaxID=1177755 RepID=A0A1E2RZI0_9HYPH|nr:hypothetical protein [Methyloligella halotolerans]ODA67469.1 hypothetical protein A7A08_01501 [Methyloligella halotolerans]
MAGPKNPEPSGDVADSRQAASQIAEQLVPMIESSRKCGMDFLAYLLGMALKEARQLAARQDR